MSATITTPGEGVYSGVGRSDDAARVALTELAKSYFGINPFDFLPGHGNYDS
ncbi:MAG: hypothetical protein ACR2MY_12335 [Candidatus Dormibacteria bacterium]